MSPVRITFLLLGMAVLAFMTAPLAADTLPRTDGSQIIYHLDRIKGGRRGAMLMLQGSDASQLRSANG